MKMNQQEFEKQLMQKFKENKGKHRDKLMDDLLSIEKHYYLNSTFMVSKDIDISADPKKLKLQLVQHLIMEQG